MRGAHDLDAVLDELGIEVAERVELSIDRRLAVLVCRMIERLADPGLECLERAAHFGQLGRIADDADIGAAYEDRVAKLDAEVGKECVRLLLRQLAFDRCIVVAIGLQRLFDLLVSAIEQPAHLRRRDLALGEASKIEARKRGIP